MKKAVKIAIAAVAIIIIGILFYPTGDKKDVKQMVMEASVLYSDNVLQTEKLPELASLNYEAALKEMEKLSSRWKLLEEKATELEKIADDTEEVALNIIPIAHAQSDDRSIIEKMYDAAPPGKRIKTLANMLGVSAKEAYALLKAEETKSADYWDKTGDRAENLENAARGVKNACKVGLYVGGLVATGGTTGVAAALSNASAIVSGADLVLEIGEDTANIFAGYNNEYTAVFSGMRTMSKPVATLMGFATLDVSDAEGVISAGTFVIDQYLSLKNDNEILGFKIDKIAENSTVDKIVSGDIDKWLDEQGMNKKPDREAVVAKITTVAEKIEVKTEEKTTKEEEKKVEQPEKSNEKVNVTKEGLLGNWYSFNMATKVKSNAPIQFKSDGMAIMKVQNGQAVTTFNYTWKLEGDMVVVDWKDLGAVMYYKIIDTNTLEWVKTNYTDGTVAEPGKNGLVGNRLIRE